MTARSRDAEPSHAEYLAKHPRVFFGDVAFERRSRYLVMRDGTRIAIDVTLPRGAFSTSSTRVPTIVRTTRYFRRFRFASPLRDRIPDAFLAPTDAPVRRRFLEHGYAWVDVDARGSGASFGERPCPWWIDGEVKDGAEVVDWITRQPWSNGLVGATGVSYDGTAAEMLQWNQHPAVKAVAPRFSLFDVYADVAFPGGNHLFWFTENWGRANAALDRNRPEEFVATVLRLRTEGGTADPRIASMVGHAAFDRIARALLGPALAGVAPVDDDPRSVMLERAIASHAKNYNVHHGAMEMTFRDDVPKSATIPGFTPDYFSPSTYVDRLSHASDGGAGAAVFSYSGWYDGGYANAAVTRHRTLRDQRNQLLIGPWVHGGLLDLDPDAPARETAFDHGTELLRFFDRHLRGEPTTAAPRVRYWLMGRGEWRSASTWPPPEAKPRAWYLAPGHRLASAPAPVKGVAVQPPTKTGTGRRTRWETLLSPYVHADWRDAREGQLVFESDPLDDDLVIAGHPVLELELDTPLADASVFAYLEDVTPDGRVRCLTEGSLRTIHRTVLHEGLHEGDGLPHVDVTYRRADATEAPVRRLAFELLPTAFAFARGHRVRLALATADIDHFASPAGALALRIALGPRSRLILPILPR